MPSQHALRWYADAMRLWRRGPLTFSAIAFVILATNIALSVVPVAGIVLGQFVLPLVECGLLYACLAADRNDRPRLRHLTAIAAARPGALAAVVATGLVIFATESIVAQLVGGYNMLAPADNPETISGMTLFATYAAGIGISLPLTFVPFAALFEGLDFRSAFTQSAAGFARNPGALALYGALSFALLMVGLATSGLGLLLALPLSAAASYAAWKDVFAIG